MTAKSTRADLRKIRSKFLHIFIALFLPITFAYSYVDQIAIEMPNSAKSFYDIRVHSFFRNLYENQTVIDTNTTEWLDGSFELERKSYVEQFLAQTYVAENELDLKPTTAEIEKAVLQIGKTFKTPAQKTSAFASLSVTDNEVFQWAMNRLTLEKFLNDMILNRVVITEQKLLDHYQTWKSTRFMGRPYVEVQKMVNDDLSQTLLDEEFQKWVDQEKRRKKIILKTVQHPS